jgi:predicted O-linked N-acetylglucosamine transferase (SPINDLY family)
MRGRHSSAILEMMGVTDTIADDVDGYVALAVRLAKDAAWRKAMSDAVGANKHKLYRDARTITAFAEFLERVASA